MNLKRLSIQLPEQLHKEVKLIAHLERETITSVAIKLLSKYAEDRQHLVRDGLNLDNDAETRAPLCDQASKAPSSPQRLQSGQGQRQSAWVGCSVGEYS